MAEDKEEGIGGILDLVDGLIGGKGGSNEEGLTEGEPCGSCGIGNPGQIKFTCACGHEIVFCACCHMAGRPKLRKYLSEHSEGCEKFQRQIDRAKVGEE